MKPGEAKTGHEANWNRPYLNIFSPIPNTRNRPPFGDLPFKFCFQKLKLVLVLLSADYSIENSNIPVTNTIQMGKYLGILGRDSN